MKLDGKSLFVGTILGIVLRLGSAVVAVARDIARKDKKKTE